MLKINCDIWKCWGALFVAVLWKHKVFRRLILFWEHFCKNFRFVLILGLCLVKVFEGAGDSTVLQFWYMLGFPSLWMGQVFHHSAHMMGHPSVSSLGTHIQLHMHTNETVMRNVQDAKKDRRTTGHYIRVSVCQRQLNLPFKSSTRYRVNITMSNGVNLWQ